MTMAAGAKLFANASFTGHQVISVEHRRREVTVGGGPQLLGEIQLPIYLRGYGKDIGDHHKKGMKKVSC
jgi:hypothetical protein